MLSWTGSAGNYRKRGNSEEPGKLRKDFWGRWPFRGWVRCEESLKRPLGRSFISQGKGKSRRSVATWQERVRGPPGCHLALELILGWQWASKRRVKLWSTFLWTPSLEQIHSCSETAQDTDYQAGGGGTVADAAGWFPRLHANTWQECACLRPEPRKAETTRPGSPDLETPSRWPRPDLGGSDMMMHKKPHFADLCKHYCQSTCFFVAAIAKILESGH